MGVVVFSECNNTTLGAMNVSNSNFFLILAAYNTQCW